MLLRSMQTYELISSFIKLLPKDRFSRLRSDVTTTRAPHCLPSQGGFAAPNIPSGDSLSCLTSIKVHEQTIQGIGYRSSPSQRTCQCADNFGGRAAFTLGLSEGDPYGGWPYTASTGNLLVQSAAAATTTGDLNAAAVRNPTQTSIGTRNAGEAGGKAGVAAGDALEQSAALRQLGGLAGAVEVSKQAIEGVAEPIAAADYAPQGELREQQPFEEPQMPVELDVSAGARALAIEGMLEDGNDGGLEGSEAAGSDGVVCAELGVEVMLEEIAGDDIDDSPNMLGEVRMHARELQIWGGSDRLLRLKTALELICSHVFCSTNLIIRPRSSLSTVSAVQECVVRSPIPFGSNAV